MDEVFQNASIDSDGIKVKDKKLKIPKGDISYGN